MTSSGISHLLAATKRKEERGVCEQPVESYMKSWGEHLLLAAPRVSIKLAKFRQRVQEKKVADGEHKGVVSEHEGAEKEHKGALRKHERAEKEYVDETGLSGRTKRRGLSQQTITCCFRFGAYIPSASN